MNIELLEGFQIKGPQINLLFYSPDNGPLVAQYWIPNAGEEVIKEIPMKSWDNCISALCTFMELNGENRKDILKKVNTLISVIRKNNLVVSE